MYIADMNMDQFARAIKKIDTAIIPVGMTEAHGHHCPLGTDNMVPRHLLAGIEKALGQKLFIAPEIPYGHSWSLADYPGTIDIPAQIFSDYVYHVAAGLARWDIRKLVLFNGHGGNIPALTLVMERLADRGVSVIMINWWKDYAEQILTVCDGQGHAGEDETSAVLAIRPDLVDLTRARSNWQKPIGNMRYPGMPKDTMTHAMTGDASKATADKGHAIFRLILPPIIDLIVRFQAAQWIE